MMSAKFGGMGSNNFLKKKRSVLNLLFNPVCKPFAKHEESGISLLASEDIRLKNFGLTIKKTLFTMICI